MDSVYLCVFEEKLDRNDLTKFLDGRPDVIKFWFWNLPHSVFIRSTLSPAELSAILESRFGQFRHFVAQTYAGYGRLPKDHWQYFK
jgi:hypothetical protein